MLFIIWVVVINMNATSDSVRAVALQSERELGHTPSLEAQVSLALADDFSPGWPSHSRQAHDRDSRVPLYGGITNIFPRFNASQATNNGQSFSL